MSFNMRSRTLKARALVLFVAANAIAAARGARAIFPTLEIAVNAVAVNLGWPAVIDELHTTADVVVVDSEIAVIGFELNVAFNRIVEHTRRAALLHLNAAADVGGLRYRNLSRVLSLNITGHAHTARKEGSSLFDLDGSLHLSPVQRTAGPWRYSEIIDAHAAEVSTAGSLLRDDHSRQ
jgi:hypothetical protein